MAENTKESKHPQYHEVTFVCTNGTKFKTRSTMGAPGQVVTLEADPFSHPAWKEKGDNTAVESRGKAALFKSKFGVDLTKAGKKE